MIEPKVIAAESGHWYAAESGEPCYEVAAKNGNKRATTLADARKLNLFPSVTMITRVAAAPGLEAWKASQLLHAALTLPRLEGETEDDYAKRVIEDSKAQAALARDKGTELHRAIEEYIKGSYDFALNWRPHLVKLDNTLKQYGIDLRDGKPEHCFASMLGYGGKLDFHNDEVLIDFKTSDAIAHKKRLAWDEHIWQLAAYDYGIGGKRRRLINVFIGIEDKEVRIHEWSEEDRTWGFSCFGCLLQFWNLKNRFGPYAE